ncbi:MAG TPA: hypothetical protein VOA88_02695 [Candidatus Dormibacteraeota bacterium]|nr:hypothetical protein [Candidatus Dormibacteraeota bacterium]
MADKDIRDVRRNHPSDQENQTQKISSPPHDPESSAQPIQTSVEVSPDALEQSDSSLNGGVEESQRIAVTCRGKNCRPLTQAQELREVEGSRSILIQLRELRIQVEQIRARADRAGDYRTSLLAVREKTRLVELEARLTGELNERPQTKILNFTLDAETARRMTETFLARHLGVNPT